MATGGPGAPSTSKPPRRKPAVPVSGDHAPQHTTQTAPVRPDDRPTPRGPAPTPAPAPVPSQPAPGSPDAQASPLGTEFTGRPNPILVSLGYMGAVRDLERRIGIVLDTYRAKFGSDPAPGLAFDVARSPFGDQHLKTLIDGTPGSAAEARSKFAVQSVAESHPYDFFQVRPDGLMVQNNPLLQKINQFVDAHPLTVHEMYPSVQVGTIPIPLAGDLMSAIKTIDEGTADGTIRVTENGIDLKEFDKRLRLAQGAMVEGGGTSFGQNREFAKIASARQAVETIRQAQAQLNVEMGTDLPVTGFFNQTWAVALGNWMKSTDYFRKVVAFQAKDAGFGKNIAAYTHAWRAKQGAVQKHGLAAHFLNAMPLPLFGHSLMGEPGAIVNYLKGPGYSWKSADFYTSMPLHTLTRSAGLTMNTMGGSLQQAKADIAATHQFVHSVAPTQYGGKGETIDEAKKRAAATLRANPTWMRIFYPDLEENGPGWLQAVDQASNLAIDLVILRKPEFTGERVGPVDALGSLRSPYLRASSVDAHKLIRANKIGRAVSRLEGGMGSEKLVDAAAGPIKRGEMSADQFHGHVVDLYTDGQTRIGDTLVHGPTLRSLRTGSLPTPGVPGNIYSDVRSAMRSTLDSADRGLRNANIVVLNSAADFIAGVRVALSHVTGSVGGYFDPKLPERVFNAALHATGDAKVANELEATLIRARARENIPAIQAVERKLQKLYALKYPAGRPSGVKDPFEPTLETEAPSVFHFPSGGHRAVDTRLAGLQVGAQNLNSAFNRIAKTSARIILATPGMGFVLGWKHLFGDTMRRYIGGGVTLRRMNESKAAIERLAAADPNVERNLGGFLARTQLGEQSWLLDRGGRSEQETFTTGEHMKGLQSKAYMNSAGGYLRRMLTDEAVHAYQASSATDIQPLVDLVLSNKTYRGLFEQAKKADPSLTAEGYAGMIRERFKTFEDAAAKAGIGNPLDSASQVMRAHRGAKADSALGDWIKANKIDMPVSKGLVSKYGGFDDVTGRYLQQIMRPNKWNRSHFAENILHKTFGALTAAGMEEKPALEIAMDLAEAQTKFHMLDFSNRLQIEQDLRWVSYFATKHRLYWKWVLGTMVRRPGTALAVADARDALDPRGNVNVHLPIGTPLGRNFSIPAARLFWVPGREYSETSPIVQFLGGAVSGGGIDPAAGFQAASGTNGNVFTRSDTAIRLGARLGAISLGKRPATYHAAVAGMPASEKRQIWRAINEYQVSYRLEHGHYASEQAAVKHVLWHSLGQEYWRANLPLPVTTSHDATTEQQKVAKFMALVDPKARRAFLDKNPDVAEHFGIYENPNLYLHNRDMFARYTNMLNAYHDARQQLYEQALDTGMTGKLALQKRKLDGGFRKQFQMLLHEDAGWRTPDQTIKYGTPGDTPLLEPKVPGPWGRLVQADPQLDPRSELTALFPKLKHSEDFKVIGQMQKEYQHELDLLNNPDYANSYPDPAELKTRRAELLQKLQDFAGYPTDALGRVQQQYNRNHVQPYWQGSDKRWQAIQKLPRTEQTVAYARYRAWRDAQDKPVVIDGVKFPSPVRMAWATLDPVTREQRLSKLAAYNWESLTDYEKNLLGFKAHKGTSEGWQWLEEYIADAQKQLPAGERLPKGYRDYYASYVAKHVPGFGDDYKLSKQPSFKRLQQMTVVTQSPFYRSEAHGASWQDLLGAASDFHKAYGNPDQYSQSGVKDTWKRYVDSSLKPWVASTPGFQRELQAYGPDFMYGLISP